MTPLPPTFRDWLIQTNRELLAEIADSSRRAGAK